MEKKAIPTILAFSNHSGRLMDHEYYLKQLYQDVRETPRSSKGIPLKFLPKLFSISNKDVDVSDEELTSPVNSKKRKRKHNGENVNEEAAEVRRKFNAFMESVPKDLKQDRRSNHDDVRKSVADLLTSTNFNLKDKKGDNSKNLAFLTEINQQQFVIPGNSRYLCGDVRAQCRQLEDNNEKFDIVIIDPPWWNKYIRRLAKHNQNMSYLMMANDDIASIQIKSLIKDQCLVAIWCTNNPTNIKAVTEKMFPNWGLDYAATWYWVKLNKKYKPICEFGWGSQKQPYERLIIGTVGDLKKVPDNLILTSVLSAVHSHKPPIRELLLPYLRCKESDAKTLELFARYLTPHTVSIGFEPLKLQHRSYFDPPERETAVSSESESEGDDNDSDASYEPPEIDPTVGWHNHVYCTVARRRCTAGRARATAGRGRATAGRARGTAGRAKATAARARGAAGRGRGISRRATYIRVKYWHKH